MPKLVRGFFSYPPHDDDLRKRLRAHLSQLERDGLVAAWDDREQANTQWQRDLSTRHDRIGDVLVARNDLDGVIDANRKSLTIREALAARAPANVQWQIDVAVSCSKLGMQPACRRMGCAVICAVVSKFCKA